MTVTRDAEPTSSTTVEAVRDPDRPEILRVWLNRPHRRNAVNDRLLLEVGDLFLGLQTDFTTRVVVLGGRGASFCAGADRKGEEDRLDPPVSEREERFRQGLGRRAARAIEECEIPVIGRLHGHAIGGGCVFAMACDFRVAAEGTMFWYPEVELGLSLSWAATPRLIQEIGAARARQLVMLCDRVDATTAAAWGMVHETVPPAELDAAVDRWIERVLAMPDTALHMTKTQFRGYQRNAALGDVSEADADQRVLASRTESSLARFNAAF